MYKHTVAIGLPLVFYTFSAIKNSIEKVQFVVKFLQNSVFDWTENESEKKNTQKKTGWIFHIYGELDNIFWNIKQFSYNIKNALIERWPEFSNIDLTAIL